MTFVLAFVCGMAGIALHLYVRFPHHFPGTFKRAMVNVVLAVLSVTLASQAVQWFGQGSSTVAMVGIVFLLGPTLIYSWLAALWIMAHLAEQVQARR